MAIDLKHTTLVLVESETFHHGMNGGANWYFHGDTPCRTVTETDVIDFLQGNIVELVQEGYLTEERLRDNAGFLIGWIAAQAFPLSATSERSIF